MYKLYSDKKDAKTQAILMYLNVKGLDHEFIEVFDKNDLDITIRNANFPLLTKDDIIVMEGYKADLLSSI